MSLLENSIKFQNLETSTKRNENFVILKTVTFNAILALKVNEKQFIVIIQSNHSVILK